MKTLLALLIPLCVPALVTAQTLQQVAADLLAADRAFAADCAKTSLVAGLTAMFASNVAMMAPAEIAYGKDKVTAALEANPANHGARAEWTPARVGLSADGSHGFTAGFMTITRTDGAVNPARYLSYWRKEPSGWRVLVYKRVPAKASPQTTTVTYILPKELVKSTTTAAGLDRDRESLAEAEQSFSRDAQTMGIGPAFKHYGSPDAINLFGPDATFVTGNEAIGEAIGNGQPPNTSPVTWGPERTIVAASADFGVTMGYIVPTTPRQGAPPRQAFFTIWRRESASAPWRYIAE